MTLLVEKHWSLIVLTEIILSTYHVSQNYLKVKSIGDFHIWW